MPKKKKAVVPRLRFPEFRDAGPWEVKRLNQLAVRITTRNRSGCVTRVLTNSAEFGVIDQRDFFDKDIAQQGSLENYFLVDKDDFVYNPRISNLAPVGPVSINRLGLGVMSPLYTVFRFKSGIDNFYAFFFESSAWHSYLLKIGNTGARHDRMAISARDFMAMPVPDPSISEQQKIADCLSSLDELIDLEAKRLDALKAHKKGLMQQLFPREGETTPRLRFPEFRDAGPWEVKRGDVLFRQVSNKQHDGTLPVLAITQEYGAIPRDLIDYHISVTKESLQSYKVVEIGDFIISLRTFQGGIEYSYYRGICSPAYIVLKRSDVRVVNDFFRHFFKTQRYIAALNRNIEGLRDGKMVSFKQFGEILLPLPKPEEQQKIADCLSSLDELIDLQAKRLDALKAHKKGLLQQLIPQEVE